MDQIDSMETASNELIVEAKVQNLHQVTEFVEKILNKKDCPLKAVMQINVAVDEIFTNISSYAYDEGVGKVRVNIDHEGDSVTITFTDKGKPFDPLEKNDPDVSLSLEHRKIGGLGIFMTKKLMDDVQYKYRDGKNILVLKKKIA